MRLPVLISSIAVFGACQRAPTEPPPSAATDEPATRSLGELMVAPAIVTGSPAHPDASAQELFDRASMIVIGRSTRVVGTSCRGGVPVFSALAVEKVVRGDANLVGQALLLLPTRQERDKWFVAAAEPHERRDQSNGPLGHCDESPGTVTNGSVTALLSFDSLPNALRAEKRLLAGNSVEFGGSREGQSSKASD